VPRAAANLSFRLELSTLKLVGKSKDTTGRSEPYLWVAFYKFDGAGIRIVLPLELSGVQIAEITTLALAILVPGNRDKLVNRLVEILLDAKLVLSGSPVTSFRPSVNENTDASRSVFGGEKFSRDESQPIPAAHGRWSESLLGFEVDIDLESSGLVGGVLDTVQSLLPDVAVRLPLPVPVFGVAYALLERDLSGKATIAAAHRAFNDELSAVLNGIGAELSLAGAKLRDAQTDPELIADRIRQKALAAAIASRDIGSVIHRDDALGSANHVFTPASLGASAPAFTDVFDKADTANRGEWHLSGRLAPGA
jgi:hypothetical protein